MTQEYGLLTMELTPEMEKVVKEQFNLEIEMMQGDKESLPGGMTKYTIKIYDDQKCEMVKEFVLKMISESHLKNMN